MSWDKSSQNENCSYALEHLNECGFMYPRSPTSGVPSSSTTKRFRKDTDTTQLHVHLKPSFFASDPYNLMKVEVKPMRSMALNSKKRSLADIDESAGPAKKQRIETTPTTFKECKVRTILSSLFILIQRFKPAANPHTQDACFVTAAPEDREDIDGAIAQIKSEMGVKVEGFKKQSGTIEDNFVELFKEQHEELIAKGDIDRASEPAPIEKDNIKYNGGIQEVGAKAVRMHDNDEKPEIAPAAGEARETPGVIVTVGTAQTRPPRSHRPRRPLRQYPGPRTGHFYKPHAVVLLDGTVQIVWYPK